MIKSKTRHKSANHLTNPMAVISLNGTPFDAALAVFDKDGTLVDFDRLWGEKAARCLAGLAARVDQATSAQVLLRSIGYDPETRKTASNSPLAIAPLGRIGEVIASELARAGVTAARAAEIVQQHFFPCMEALPGEDLIHPLGNVRGLFQKMAARGIRLAVVTSDDRLPTLKALEVLGLEDLVAEVVCADDPIAHKPDPAAVFHLCGRFGVSPAGVLVVGDNPSDMIMGRAAGAGLSAGVLSGNSSRRDLAGFADVIIESIDEIEVN